MTAAAAPLAAAGTERPDPGTLDSAGLARLFAVLREERLALMTRLAALEAAPPDDPAAFIDRMEARAALQEVLDYLRRLQARAKHIEQWQPAGSTAPLFTGEQGDGRRWIAARAQCPLTPDSALFLHGPTTLWHAAALAERLLAPDDRLAWLRKASFHAELTHEPDMLVWDLAHDPPPLPLDRGAAAVQGSFETAAGRHLGFVAVASPEHPVTRKADYHPMVPQVHASRPVFDHASGQLRHRIPPAPWPAAGTAVTGAAAVFALVETIVTTLTQGLEDGRRMYLFSTLADRAIPEDFGAWLAAGRDVQVDLFWTRKRTVPGRGAFVPGRYRVGPDDTDWTRGVLVCLDSHVMF